MDRTGYERIGKAAGQVEWSDAIDDEILQAILSISPDPILIQDIDGHLVSASMAFSRLVGAAAPDLIGKVWNDDIELGDLPPMEAIRRDALNSGESIHVELCTKEGGRHVVSVIPLMGGKEEAVGTIAIARRMAMEKDLERLREEGDILHRMMESVRDLVYFKDLEGRYVMANASLRERYGVSPEELLGKRDIDLLDDRGGALSIMANDRKVLQSGAGEMFEEYLNLRDGGHTFLTDKMPGRDEKDNIIGVIGISRDITERKRLEMDLEESMRTTELYLDILTHDIRNYMAAAMGYLQLLEIDLSAENKEQVFISRSLQALAGSSELIANIRDLKNIEAGRDKLETIDICSLLDEIRENYKNPPDRDVSISLLLHGDCKAHASRLLRGAFSNLVSNSIKHSAGSVDIHIVACNQIVDGKEMVRVDVSDDGPGIPDDKKTMIFDRSLMGLAKPVSRGLGLYLVKRLVESYGGHIRVEDRIPGDYTQGARFIVLLPRAH